MLDIVIIKKGTTMSRNYEEMKALINSAGGQFASVTFIKKDGSRRVMNVQPATGKFKLAENPSESHVRAAETRAANNPHLMPIWDVAKKAFRSINFDTVEEIKVRGKAYTF